jgi:predicted ferric reductase
MYELVVPLGIITYFFVLFVVLSGLKIIKVKFKVHKYIGIIALLLATFHGALILYLSYVE